MNNKKEYIKPQIALFKIDAEYNLLAGSPGKIEGGSVIKDMEGWDDLYEPTAPGVDNGDHDGEDVP